MLVVWQDSEYTSAFGISQSLRYDTYKKEAACLFFAFVEHLFWFQFRIIISFKTSINSVACF